MTVELPLQIGAVPIEWLLVGLPALVALMLFVLIFGGNADLKHTRRRVDRIKLNNAPQMTPAEIVSIRRSNNDSGIAILDSLVKHLLPRPELLRLRLTSAGLKLSLGNYVMICLLVGLTVFGVLYFTKVVTPLVAGLFGCFLAIMLPHAVIGFLMRRRRNKFIAYFPEAIDLMVRGLRSGLPITESIRTAGEEILDPVGIELRRITDSVRLDTGCFIAGGAAAGLPMPITCADTQWLAGNQQHQFRASCRRGGEIQLQSSARVFPQDWNTESKRQLVQSAALEPPP